ncbi:DUF4288 domain-containing protein [Anaerolineales bacterium HSG6]|nr:DUF4288 domain-containing protein [Anaerolineales bacterium HSG6]
MNWYIAHVIMYVKFKDGVQDSYPIWENMILIGAETDEEAMQKVTERAEQDEGDCDGSFTWNERPATWCFAGVRKLISSEDFDERPTSGTEVSYTELVVNTEEDFKKLVNGDPVLVQYIN